MKVYVISLANSHERRERISNILNSMGINFRFFDAVNGREGLPSDLVGLPDDTHRKIFRSRPLSPGEKGCYASHYRLWQKCVELGEAIVVIEDDCLPTDFMTGAIPTLQKLHQNGYEYIRLEHQKGKATLLEEVDGMQTVFWHNNLVGTRGYSISPNGAKKLLAKSERWLCAVDNFIGESYRTKLKCTGLIPYIVLDPNDMETTIQIGENEKTPLYFKVTRELYRFYRYVRLTSWNSLNNRL